MKWRESLKTRERSRSPFGIVQPSLWSLKEQSCFKQSCSKILLMSLIKTLFMDQLSFLGINPQIKTLVLLDFSSKQEPMLTIQLALFVRESVKRLLVPYNLTKFFSDGDIDRFMARQSRFSARSTSILEFNTFNGAKYLCHTFKYLERPDIMQ